MDTQRTPSGHPEDICLLDVRWVSAGCVLGVFGCPMGVIEMEINSGHPDSHSGHPDSLDTQTPSGHPADICALGVRCVSAGCPLGVRCVSAGCPLCVRWVSAGCFRN